MPSLRGCSRCWCCSSRPRGRCLPRCYRSRSTMLHFQWRNHGWRPCVARRWCRCCCWWRKPWRDCRGFGWRCAGLSLRAHSGCNHHLPRTDAAYLHLQAGVAFSTDTSGVIATAAAGLHSSGRGATAGHISAHRALGCMTLSPCRTGATVTGVGSAACRRGWRAVARRWLFGCLHSTGSLNWKSDVR